MLRVFLCSVDVPQGAQSAQLSTEKVQGGWQDAGLEPPTWGTKASSRGACPLAKAEQEPVAGELKQDTLRLEIRDRVQEGGELIPGTTRRGAGASPAPGVSEVRSGVSLKARLELCRT